MVEESPFDEREPLCVVRWGPVLVRPQWYVVMSSFPFSMVPAALCISLGIPLGFIQHWAWFTAAAVAAVWFGNLERRLLAPFRVQPLHPAIVSDAATGVLSVLLGIEEHDGQLFVQLVRIRDDYSMRWLRRFRSGQRLLMGLVRDDDTLRPHRIEAITRDRKALDAAYGSIPDGAWQALEAAERGFDPSAEPGIQRIPVGPGQVQERAPEQPKAAAQPVAERGETYRACASLIEAAPLALGPEQLAQIRSARSRQLQVAALSLLGSLLGPVLMYISAQRPQHEREHSLLLDVAIVAIIASLPLLFRSAVSWSFARRYARDVAAGALDTFAGRINVYEAAFADPQQAWLLERQLLSPDPQRVQSVAVGRASRRIWLANGEPVGSLQIAQIASIAPVPEDAVDLPLPPELAVDLPVGWRMKRREFTAEESAELARHVARSERIGAWNWLVLVAGPLAVLGLLAIVRSHASQQLSPVVVFALLGWVGILGSAIWRQRQSMALERDRRAGFCLVLLPSYSDSLAHPELRREHLPESRRLWAQLGRPAPWRSTEH